MWLIVLIALIGLIWFLFGQPVICGSQSAARRLRQPGLRSARPLQIGDVVEVRDMHPVDQKLPLGNLGILVEPKHVIFPTLTSSDQVRYVDRYYDLAQIQRAAPSNSLQRRKIELLAPIIEEHLELEPEVKRIEKLQRRLEELQRLADSSETFIQTSQTLRQRLSDLTDWLNEAAQIQQSTLSYLRDMLIANELDILAPELGSFSPQLKAQYRSLRGQYQELQDEAELDFPNLPQR
jgi:chaperonin cofactor prefoldin